MGVAASATQAAGLVGKGHNPHFLSSAVSQRGRHSRAAWRVVQASAGDHPMIHQFLVSVFHKPSPAEFQAQLEEPSYEPSDRLLIKNGNQIVAHLRLLNREMRFGGLVLPVGMIADLATLPEYRGHGCATALLSAARKMLLARWCRAGVAGHRSAALLYASWLGCLWAPLLQCFGTARDPLASEAAGNRIGWRCRSRCSSLIRRKRYNIRLWRHVELAALMRLYEENTQHGYGNLVRSDAYWRWLVGRGGNQRIYVAINGPDKIELDESLTPIVGYAATREGRIVEIMSAADHPEASVQLLARACGDAIEKDFLRVRLDAPPEQPLHQLLVQAGGEYRLP